MNALFVKVIIFRGHYVCVLDGLSSPICRTLSRKFQSDKVLIVRRRWHFLSDTFHESLKRTPRFIVFISRNFILGRLGNSPTVIWEWSVRLDIKAAAVLTYTYKKVTFVYFVSSFHFNKLSIERYLFFTTSIS